NPYGGLVQGCDGNFYGTCYYGGANSFGTVFRLTMPLSPAPNQISRIQVAGSNVSVTVPSVAGETYQLQSRLSLTTGSWSNVPGATVVNSIGSALTLTNLGGAVPAQAFYRMWIRIGGIPVSAWDTAAEDAYSGGWTTGSNGGYGFNPWTLTGIGSHFGYFIGSSTNNAGVSQPGIDTSGMSWSAFADGDSYTAAYRTFAAGSLAVGQSLLLNLDNGYIDNGQTVGFALRTGNASSGPDDYNVGARFEFFFLGGRANYQVADTAVHDLGTGYTGTGKRLVFTLTTADAYTLLTIDNANGTTNTFSGTLGGTLGTTVDSIAIYNRNAGNGPNFDAYFNSLQITGP
ncbi:MAG: choice-of-anchor tandem repeat GloVer-containing protein, partial [Verrucomicrobiota bacterium]